MFLLSLCTTLHTWNGQCQPAVKHKTQWEMSQHCLQTGHVWGPKALQRLSIYLYKHLKGGCEADGQSQPFSVMPSDRAESAAIGTNWNTGGCTQTPENVLQLQWWLSTGTGCLQYSQATGKHSGHPALAGPAWARAWGQIISTSLSQTQPLCGSVTLRCQQDQVLSLISICSQLPTTRLTKLQSLLEMVLLPPPLLSFQRNTSEGEVALTK